MDKTSGKEGNNVIVPPPLPNSSHKKSKLKFDATKGFAGERGAVGGVSGGRVGRLGGGGEGGGGRLHLLPKEGLEAEAANVDLQEDLGLKAVQVVVFNLGEGFSENEKRYSTEYIYLKDI